VPTTICRHIRANGVRCKSAALRGEPLCYYHHRDHLRYPNRSRPALAPEDNSIDTILHPLNTDSDGSQRDPLRVDLRSNPLIQEYFSPPHLGGGGGGGVTLDFPPLEDRDSIQIAISMVISALGQGLIETRRAGMMLYALQVASANAKTLTHDADSVTDVVPAPDGRDLAPDEDPEPEPEPVGSAVRMLMELEALDR
jgi:hypothetical protein